jgi:hypothetical protein
MLTRFHLEADRKPAIFRPLAEGSLAFTTAKPQGERILEDFGRVVPEQMRGALEGLSRSKGLNLKPDKNLGKPVAELFEAARYAAMSVGGCLLADAERKSYLITPQAIRAPPPASGAGASE